MRKSALTAVTLILVALVVGLSGCITINPPTASAPPTPAPTLSPPTPGVTPQYHTLSFTVEANSDYSFPIYLRNNETLHLMWRVEDGENKIWFHIITPSGKPLGFYENGQYANGTLQEGFCQGFTIGMTQFRPSDYGWGEGYYTMYPTNTLAAPVTIKMEYWISVPSPTPPTGQEHSTIYPKGNETSFELTPNTSCSIVVYLQKNQWLKVNYLFSPTDLGGQVIYVHYTYPEGNQVGVAGNPGDRRSFDTLPGHNEGYYSIDFDYLVGEANYDPDIYRNVDIYVRWEVKEG